MKENKEKCKEVLRLINENLKELTNSEEDKEIIVKLVNTYYRKRGGILNSKIENMAAAFFWVYSKSNFLWEANKKWSCQGLSELFNANPKTVGAVASKIIKSLKIDLWDERFCRQDVMKDNPYDKFVMLKSGLIVPKEMLGLPPKYPSAQRKTKEDYFDEAMEFLEQDDREKTIEYLNKALALDENYTEAINELGFIYFDEDIEKSKEYYKKSFELSKKELGGNWPKELNWGILENRPYMRAIQGLALIFWREYEIEKAKELFNLLLGMNPWDNQGIRYCMATIYKGMSWEEFGKVEDKCVEKGKYDEMDNLLKEQNEFYKFWKSPEKNE